MNQNTTILSPQDAFENVVSKWAPFYPGFRMLIVSNYTYEWLYINYL